MEEISIKRKERHLYKREDHLIGMGVNLEVRKRSNVKGGQIAIRERSKQ